MRSRVIFILLFWLLAAPAVNASSWLPWADEDGNIYLQASSIPLVEDDEELFFLQQPNTLLQLTYVDGNWHALPLSMRDWRALSLERGHSDVRQVIKEGGSRASALLLYRNGVHYHLNLKRVGRDTLIHTQEVDLSPRFVPLQGSPQAPVTSIRPQTEIESTPYNFRVSETGAATIEVPLSIPRGIGGMKPDVGISYSSQSSDGPMGIGWSLNAGSAIRRCPPMPGPNGSQRALSFDASDRLCLDGQRLLVQSGETNYWGPLTMFLSCLLPPRSSLFVKAAVFRDLC